MLVAVMLGPSHLEANDPKLWEWLMAIDVVNQCYFKRLNRSPKVENNLEFVMIHSTSSLNTLCFGLLLLTRRLVSAKMTSSSCRERRLCKFNFSTASTSA